MRPRILIVGHGAAATGFSRVIHALVESLCGAYDFHHFATNHRTERVDGAWPIYGNPDPLDAHGLERLGDLIERLRPELVLILHDLWFCSIHARRLESIARRPRTVAYCPIDGALTRPALYSALALFDQVVAYNRFGEAELEQIAFRGAPLAAHCVLERIEVIPHGVDRERFFPMQSDLLDRGDAKRRLFGERAAEADFIVLNAAKHDARKRIDLTISGFARFARDRPPGVKLYLHTGALWDGVDLRELVRRAGIADRLITTAGWLRDHPSVDDRTLNLIYNATDVGLNTSSGEGWGLVSCEHAATGAPQAVPAHTGCGELWRETATTLPVSGEAEHVGLGMLRQFVAEQDVARILERLYSDADFRAEQARRSFGVACEDAYRWSRIAARWDEVFQGVLAAEPAT